MATNVITSPVSDASGTIFDTDSPLITDVLLRSIPIVPSNQNAGSKRSDNRELVRSESQLYSSSDTNESSTTGSAQFTTPPMMPVATFPPQSHQPVDPPGSPVHDESVTSNPQTRPEDSQASDHILLASIKDSGLMSPKSTDSPCLEVPDGQHTSAQSEANPLSETYNKLDGTLQLCWALLTNLAGLSKASWSPSQVRPRPVPRTRPSLSGSAWSAPVSESTGPSWLPCWELVQKLYSIRASTTGVGVATILDLIRPFAQYVGRLRSRVDETADGLLRTALGLADHLYSFADPNLPAEFWERALDYHVILCHRWMKQRALEMSLDRSSGYGRDDNILIACWTVVETLLVLLKSERHDRLLAKTKLSNAPARQNLTVQDVDQLSSTVQACFALEDTFRHSWRHMVEFETPKPVQSAIFASLGRGDAYSHPRFHQPVIASSDLPRFDAEDYQVEPPLESALPPSEYTATTATIDESGSLYSFDDVSPRSTSPFQSPLGISNMNDMHRLKRHHSKPPQSEVWLPQRSLSLDDHKYKMESYRGADETHSLIGGLRGLSNSFAINMPETPSTIFEDIDHHPGMNLEDERRQNNADKRDISRPSLTVGMFQKDELTTAIQRFAPTSTLRSRRSSTGSIPGHESVDATYSARSIKGYHDNYADKVELSESSPFVQEKLDIEGDSGKKTASRSSSALSQSTAMPGSVKRHDSGS